MYSIYTFMPFTNMSDGRNFTDYRTQKEQMAAVSKKYNVYDSKSLRQTLTTQADDLMTHKECTPKQATGMSVLCGGPIIPK